MNLFDPPYYRTPTECQLLDANINLFTDWLIEYLENDKDSLDIIPYGNVIIVLKHNPTRYYGRFCITNSNITHKKWKMIGEIQNHFIYSWNNEHLENL